jgi:hypothetical protein
MHSSGEEGVDFDRWRVRQWGTEALPRRRKRRRGGGPGVVGAYAGELPTGGAAGTRPQRWRACHMRRNVPLG